MESRDRTEDDWSPLDELIRKQMSFLKGSPWIDGVGLDTRRMQTFVEALVSRCLQSPFGDTRKPRHSAAEGDYEMLETAAHICVRYPVPEGGDAGDIVLLVSRSKLKIRHDGSVSVIDLPADIVPENSYVTRRQGWLDIRLSKTAEQPPFREIKVMP